MFFTVISRCEIDFNEGFLLFMKKKGCRGQDFTFVCRKHLDVEGTITTMHLEPPWRSLRRYDIKRRNDARQVDNKTAMIASRYIGTHRTI